MAHFKKFVSALPDGSSGDLPLTHVTDAFDTRGIIADEKLDARLCEVFKKPLLYFFLGRPAYRKNSEIPAGGRTSYYPVAFIISPSVIQSAAQIYPFDSGAFEAGLYKDFLHKRMKVDSFSLEKDLSTPGKLISFFFETNLKYYDRSPLAVSLPPIEFEVNSYYDLISDRGLRERDDRSSTVEIAIDKPLTIDSTNVLAVIVPYCFVAAPGIGKTLADLKIKVIPYDDSNGLRPSENIGRLYDITKGYFISEGWL